jgi:hypothetical protein
VPRSKNEWSYIIHSPNTPSWSGAQIKHRDNFTFTVVILRRTILNERTMMYKRKQREQPLVHVVLLHRGVGKP